MDAREELIALETDGWEALSAGGGWPSISRRRAEIMFAMEEAFATLVWVVAAVGVVVAIFTLIGTGRSYREIGGGGIVHDTDRAAGPGAGAASADAERDDEIRQMLEARNMRRARRGEEQQDVEAELAALTRPAAAVDDGLREEIRQHVVASNARRARAGANPLDVEQEIERRIRDLT